MHIPADIPLKSEKRFIKNYQILTKHTDKLFIFAADHKMEHLNQDFSTPSAHPDAATPEHIFKIASQGYIGGLATQLGLITQYGNTYKKIPYIIKMNSKTNTIADEYNDPLSSQLYHIHDIIHFANNTNLSICGVGYTIYLGSLYEQTMLSEASELIYHAHQHGIVTILWIYPKFLHPQHEIDAQISAGASGVAACLGSDFAKIHHPEKSYTSDNIRSIVQAAGKTKLIISGGNKTTEQALLDHILLFLNAGFSGCAIGRNIFQRSLIDGINLTQKINQLVYQ